MSDHVESWRGAASVGWMLALVVWETVAPHLPLFQGAGVGRWRHAVRNLVIGLLNVLLVRMLFVGGWHWVALWAEGRGMGLLRAVTGDGMLRWLAALLLLDLWTYAWHRASHRIGMLWIFHRMHHSDAWMDVTTANRFHLGEILISSVVRLGLIPILGIRFEQLVVYETLLQFVVQFHHANVRLPARLEGALSWLIVTPDIHKVHHSRWQPETDSNFASILPFWDRLFGTFRRHADPESLRLGLDGFDGDEFQTVPGMLLTPVKAPRAVDLPGGAEGHPGKPPANSGPAAGS